MGAALSLALAEGVRLEGQSPRWNWRATARPAPLRIVNATSRRASCKLGQANPNKNKQNSLDLFGFIWRNRDFSMGYSRKNKKIFLRADSPPRLCPKRAGQCQNSTFLPRGVPGS